MFYNKIKSSGEFVGKPTFPMSITPGILIAFVIHAHFCPTVNYCNNKYLLVSKPVLAIKVLLAIPDPLAGLMKQLILRYLYQLILLAP